ncbi:MAG TPA: type II toxin-antitoxin system RelE/ParE family toxin [Candidatus Saccharimonadia bacterium]
MIVTFWTSKSGRCPVADFIAKQHKAAAQRIMKDIDHLEQQGLKLAISPNKLKPLQGYKKLYELKTDWGGVGYRIIFAIIDGKAWLLEAFKKKGNSTPQRHIDTALRRQVTIASAD